MANRSNYRDIEKEINSECFVKDYKYQSMHDKSVKCNFKLSSLSIYSFAAV